MSDLGPVGDPEGWARWFAALEPEKRREIEQLAARAPRFGPNEGPQTEAYISEASVTGYGGAAGGGKSALMILLALQKHHRTVMFRSEKSQLDGVIDEMKRFYGSDTGLNHQAGRFYFHGLNREEGHLCEFGGIGDPGEEGKWQGRQHDLICFDEVTEIPRDKVMWLRGWNRTYLQDQRCRTVMTFNPPGSATDAKHGGGRWVIDYFAPWVDPRYKGKRAESGEIRWFCMGPNNEDFEVDGPGRHDLQTKEGVKFSRKAYSKTFIAAKVDDNPRVNPDYKDHLDSMPEPTRSRLLLGKFTSSVADQENQLIPGQWVDEAVERWKDAVRDGRADEIRSRFGMGSMGMDVARGGQANTVLAPRYGWFWDRLIRKPGADTPDGPTAAAFAVANVRDGATICIDANGIGAAPYDFLRNQKVRVVPVMGASRANLPVLEGDANKCQNQRSALWWLARLVMDPANGYEVMIPDDRVLIRELVSPIYERSVDRIVVEKKSQVRKRLGYSPDSADAWINSLMRLDGAPGLERIMRGARKVDKSLLYGRRGAASGSWMSR